jgi:hypothetical protein
MGYREMMLQRMYEYDRCKADTEYGLLTQAAFDLIYAGIDSARQACPDVFGPSFDCAAAARRVVADALATRIVP